MKKIIALLLTIVMVFAFVACQNNQNSALENNNTTASDYEYITEKGKIIVGVTDYAPMDYKDENGEWTGFDAEFAQAVAKLMNVEIEFVEIDWDNKFL